MKNKDKLCTGCYKKGEGRGKVDLGVGGGCEELTWAVMFKSR